MIIVIPTLRELADEVQDLGDELRVERARDLVQQHQLRAHGEGAHDRDPLLLSAGEPVGELVGLLGEADALEQLECLAARLAAAEPPAS